MKKALIAMSGGVDSSVAALIMKEKGYECVGAMMKLLAGEDSCAPGSHVCCTLEDAEDARSVAYQLGMDFYVFNFSERFRERVIDKFIYSYEHGCTPNPCIDCNMHLKFDKLFERADALGCGCVATGHYARTEKDQESGRYILKRALDETKDQSYVLYSLSQERLARIRFPLGGMKKTDVRRIAGEHGFVNAKKHDSQDICFVRDGKYYDFIRNYSGREYPGGDFIDKDGNVLGRHKGIIRYTIGQRKGLGIALGDRTYVTSVNPGANTVTLGTDRDLFGRELTANNINLISVPRIAGEMRVTAKIRYRHTPAAATVTQTGDDTIRVVFDEPQRAITPGQALVMYDGDVVVGGGTII